MSRSRRLSFIDSGLSGSEGRSLSPQVSEASKGTPSRDAESNDKVVQIRTISNDFQRQPSVEDWDGSKSFSTRGAEIGSLLCPSGLSGGILGGDLACDDGMHDPFRY
eukprot:Hpha_TRINITY_DN16122_c1_g6::TRINITY_DN16122_c1_g6_i1::g.7273::m.7273